MKRYHMFTLIVLSLLSTIVSLPQPIHAHDADYDLRPKERTTENMRERKEERRAKFQEKIKTISDEKKRGRIEEINTHFDSINKRYTTMLLNVLSKYEAILKRIITKTSTLAKDGTNTAPIDADITDAEFAIDEAKNIISKQADTDYTISITDEASIKKNILETRSHLHSDLKIAREAVKHAHDVIKIAAQTLQDIKNTH